MRILLCHKDISSAGCAGGFSTLYINLAQYFFNMGHEVAVITGRLEPWNLKVDRYIVSDTNLSIRRKKITEAINLWKPDIAECAGWGAELSDYVSTANRANVFVRGDIPSKFYPEAEYMPEEENLARQADAVIAVSSWCSSQWTAITEKQVVIVPHGVHKPRYKNFKKDAKLIVWIGKATWMKGIDLLSDIASKITVQYKLVCVVGPALYENKQAIEKLSRAGVSIVTGLSTNAYQSLLAKASFILSTARKEGFCIAVLEGMAYGAIPIVPEWIGGTLDFVTPELGLIFHTLDEIPHLLHTTDYTKSEYAQQRALSYSWYRTAEETIAVYQLYAKERHTS